MIMAFSSFHVLLKRLNLNNMIDSQNAWTHKKGNVWRIFKLTNWHDFVCIRMRTWSEEFISRLELSKSISRIQWSINEPRAHFKMKFIVFVFYTILFALVAVSYAHHVHNHHQVHEDGEDAEEQAKAEEWCKLKISLYNFFEEKFMQINKFIQ